jgi:hypothetical protein
MPHILLAGAGFTRNWGGWLARELEGDLLARLAGDPELRWLVQASGNYEEALESARQAGSSGAGPGIVAVRRFEEVIKASLGNEYGAGAIKRDGPCAGHHGGAGVSGTF